MPRVASEAPSVLPSRAHPTSARTPSEKSTKPTPSPFSEMLDSAAPAADSTARQPQIERPTRTEKPKAAKSSDERPAETKPAPDKATGKNTDAAARPDDAKTASESKDRKTTDASVEADAARTGPDSALGTSLDTITDAAAQAVPGQPAAAAPPATVVTPVLSPAAAAPAETAAAVTGAILEGAAPNSDQDAPVTAKTTPGAQQIQQAASEKSSSGVLPTAAKLSQSETSDSQDAEPEGISPAPPQAGLARPESSSEAKPRSGDDKAAAEFHRTFGELIAGHDSPDAPASGRGDASTATGPANSGPAAGVPIQSNAPAGPAPAANSASAQPQMPAVAVPLAGLAVEIATQARGGNNHFDIRLDPPELGRINVKLDVDRDGNVATRLVVDRSDTLDLLKRDASTLERALQQAGLKTSDHGLDFSLRQHAFTEQDTTPQSGAARVVVPDDDSAPLDALRQGYGRLLGLGGGLDIRV